MNPTAKSPVMIYSEQTPNPETLKFVTNKMLYNGTADFRDQDFAKEWSPMAYSLFEQPYVKGVYISKNYVTLTKEFNYLWEDIMLKAKQFIKEYLEDGGTIIKDGFTEAMKKIQEEKRANMDYSNEDDQLVTKIKDLIDAHVKPAVEMDGGNIEFKSFEDGVVTVVMQGACSGCPSSSLTLKSGIEGMLQRMIPEVKEVVAEMG